MRCEHCEQWKEFLMPDGQPRAKAWRQGECKVLRAVVLLDFGCIKYEPRKD